VSNKKVFDEMYMELESWSKLVSNQDFRVFIDQLEKRITRYSIQVDSLSTDFSAESTNRIRDLLSRKNELTKLLQFFDHKVKEKQRYIQKETQNGERIRTN